MKLKTNKTLTVEVPLEEITSLLTRLVEKKSGKKVTNVDVGSAASFVFKLADETEETDLEAKA
jgi:hypothetical protein